MGQRATLNMGYLDIAAFLNALWVHPDALLACCSDDGQLSFRDESLSE